MAVIFNNINKFYGENHVLKELNIKFNDGETTVIVGSSGSGKSTMLRCINLLEIPDSGKLSSGQVSFDFDNEEDITEKEMIPFRKNTGMVFQGFNLFPHQTILENVCEGPIHVSGKSKDEAVEAGMKLLKLVGLEDKVNAYPNDLSGGQQQRVAIARALAMEPEFLLMDEPTSALDPELEMEVLSVIQNISEEGQSLIIVTHNMAFARLVGHRLLFLDNGKIQFDGNPEMFFNSDDNRIKQFLSIVEFGRQ